MSDYIRLEGETDEELIYRVCSEKDVIGSWQEVADILNGLLGTEYTESKFRKQFQSFQKMLEANANKIISGESYCDDINEKILELKKERAKLQAEKVEYNKWLRENARGELITEKICKSVEKIEPIEVPTVKTKVDNDAESGYLLCLSDAHFGYEFELKDIWGVVINKYSPDVFYKRMWELFGNICDYITKEQIRTLDVWELGDGINGILRLNSQLMKLKYGIIDSAVLYADFLAVWLNRLSYLVHVNFQMVIDSNHNQLRICGAPKNAFVEENMSKVILTIIKARLRENENVTIIENVNGTPFIQYGDNTVLGCHGEMKDMPRFVEKFSKLHSTRLDYLICGHMHHSYKEEIGINSEVLRVGSIMGTDPYAISLNEASDPSCSIFKFDGALGKTQENTFKLR